jgi:hypothetical protein
MHVTSWQPSLFLQASFYFRFSERVCKSDLSLNPELKPILISDISAKINLALNLISGHRKAETRWEREDN